MPIQRGPEGSSSPPQENENNQALVARASDGAKFYHDDYFEIQYWADTHFFRDLPDGAYPRLSMRWVNSMKVILEEVVGDERHQVDCDEVEIFVNNEERVVENVVRYGRWYPEQIVTPLAERIRMEDTNT